MPYFGSDITAGMKIASTWHTAVALGANDGGYLDTVDLALAREIVPDESAGFAGLEELYRGKVDEGFELECALRWSNSLPWVHLFALIGNESTSLVGASTAYSHTAQVDHSIEGHFYTFAALIGGNNSYGVHEVPSVKPVGATISVDGNGFLHAALRGIKDGVNVGDSNAQSNDAVSMSNVTAETSRLRIPFKIGKFRINAQSDAALADSNAMDVRDLELTINRSFERDDPASADTYQSTEWETEEPKATTETVEVLLKISYDWDANNQAWWNDLDPSGGPYQYKADLQWQGALIEAGYYYLLKFEFPQLQLIEQTYPVDGQNRLVATATFRAMVASSAPTGMTGITRYLKMTLINTRSSNYGA